MSTDQHMGESGSRPKHRLRTGLTWATWLLAVGLIAGCAQQRIRDTAAEHMKDGRYEEAISTLKQGVQSYPESALLRSGLVTAQSDVINQLVAQATAQRAAGQWEDARQTLDRALKLHPEHPRLRDISQQLLAEQYALQMLEKAQSMAKGGQSAQLSQALNMLDQALVRAPRQAQVLAYKRELEGRLRASTALARQHSLAETRPISLSFRQAPLSMLLEAVRDGTGINFVLDRDVQTDQRASVFIREAKAEDAIDLMLSAFNLSRRIVDGKTLLIYPNTLEKHKEHREQVIRVFHLSHVDVKATSTMLQNVLRIQPPYVDEKANMMVLREPPEIIALAERLVGLHDMGEAEVMLEVEVLEIKSSRLTELGVNFPNSFSLSLLPLPNQTAITVDTFNNLNLRGGLNNINYAQVGLTVGGLLVNLKREVGDFNTLANPRIRARNKEKATILVGDKVPVITTTAAASGGFISESVNYLDVGLKLDVEPTVSPDDEVAIKLALEVSSPTREVRSATGTVAYQIGTRNANTTLRLRDGETQLLGGLISNEDRVTSNRVPGLGDLPLAGRLFSSQKDDVQRTELVLAITPRILRSAPKPDLAQAEMWVGTESFTRLRPPPQLGVRPNPGPVGASLKTIAQGGVQHAQGSASAAPSIIPSDVNRADAKAAEPAAGDFSMVLAGPAAMKVGEEATVELLVRSDRPLTALPLSLQYSTPTLQVLQVSEGNFFTQSDAVSSFTHAVRAQDGRINIGLLGNSGKGAVGEGTVVSLRVKAIAPGQASIGWHSGNVMGQGGVVPLGVKPQWSVTIP